MSENVIGFTIKGYSDKGVKAIKKNAKIPFLMRSLISKREITVNPYIVEIRLKKKFFKKGKNDPTKRLIISSAEKLIDAINNEMVKASCEPDLDYNLEVIRE